MLLLTAALSACQPEKPEPPPAATLCGNGIIEAGEGCDGNCPASCNDNLACTRDVLTGSASTCNAACTHQHFNENIYGDVWAQDVNILHFESDWSGYVDVSARAPTKISAGIRDLEANYIGSSAGLVVDLLYYGDASLGDTQVVAVLSKTGIDARNNYWDGAIYLPDLAALFAMPTNNPYASDAASRTVDYNNSLWSRVSNAGPR